MRTSLMARVYSVGSPHRQGAHATCPVGIGQDVKMRWTLEAGMVVRRFGSGPELVWIHGLGEQSSSFDAIARRVDGCTHVLVDLPGYGRSPWPDAPSEGDSLVGLADHLAGWLADSRPILAGHSMGGVLGQLLAERSAIGALVDIDGNISEGDCAFSSKAIRYSEEEFARHGFAKLRDGVYRGGLDDPALRGYHAGMLACDPRAFYRNACDLVTVSKAEGLASRLAALDVPVLFIAGVPRGICARSHELLAGHGIPTVGIANSGHWPFLDQPAAFGATISEFLANCTRL